MARANLRPACSHGSPVLGSTCSHSSGSVVCRGSTLHSASRRSLSTFLVIFSLHVRIGFSGGVGTV